MVEDPRKKTKYTDNWLSSSKKRLVFFLFSLKKHCDGDLPGGAGKSIARQGMKQATATKLGIYSTYSPQNSINILARCSNFCKPLQNNSEGCPSNQLSAAAMTSASDEKWRKFNFFFQSREQVAVRWSQIRRIGWVIKIWEAQVGQFLLGCKCSVCRSIVVQEQDHLGDLPAAYFLQNILQLHQQRWAILRVDSLALWNLTLVNKIKA